MMPSLVSLDLETTGFDSKKDAIIEIGAVKLMDPGLKQNFKH